MHIISVQSILAFLVFSCLMNIYSSRLWAQRQLSCDTSSINSSVIFNCRGRKLLHVLPNISWNVTRLELAYNKTERIYSEFFWNLSRLTSLNILRLGDAFFPKATYNVTHLYWWVISLEQFRVSTLLNLTCDIWVYINSKVLDLSGNCHRCANAPFPFRTCHTKSGSMEIYPDAFRSLSYLELRMTLHMENLSVLNLGTNFIEIGNLSVFNNFHNLSIIYSPENKLTFSSRYPGNVNDLMESDGEVQGLGRRFEIFIHKDEDYNLYPPSVMKECLNYGPALLTSVKSNIFYFNPKRFQGVSKVCKISLALTFLVTPSGFLSMAANLSIFPNLKYFDLSHNKMYLSHDHALHALKNLEVLDLSYNKHYFVVMGVMPFLKHLNFRKVLNLSWNKISILTDKQIKSCSLQELQFRGNRLDVLFEWELDLSKNSLDFVDPQLLTGKLRKLNLSHDRSFQLTDGFREKARSLRTLDLSFSKLKIINHSTFTWEPNNYMKELLIEGNPFDCTCNIIDFTLWMEKNYVYILCLATGVTCHTSLERKHKGVIYFDINEYVNDKALILHLLSSSFIFSTLAVIKGYHYLQLEESIFDAFVTCNTKDPLVSDCVSNHLMVQLEELGERDLPICLEEGLHPEQDLQDGHLPGPPAPSGQQCGRDCAAAPAVLCHFRFFCLRKRICENSVLEWPRNPQAESWFWQNLRSTIRVDNQTKTNMHFTNRCTEGSQFVQYPHLKQHTFHK
uniref:Toll like receptor 8 n=1 Tax=Scleropages formosus TaxID=113540 RepID=A0A8C9R7Q9_SCLFO